ncbi:MAG: SdpI family protein [Verrucomicrobiales bacterium]|nr:SdpI family protein [Verrucomicrobiales bacterium]
MKRNQLYGFRTRKTLSSDEIWYPANQYAGKALLWWSGAALITGLCGIWFFQPTATLDIVMTSLALTVLIPCLLSFIWLKKHY